MKLLDLEQIVAYIRDGHPAVRPQAELRRLKVKAMVLFLFRTGVRVSELCALAAGMSIWPKDRPASTGRRAARAGPSTSMPRLLSHWWRLDGPQ